MRRILIVAVAVGALGLAAQPEPAYDLLITGGRVVDGLGTPSRAANVAVKNGTIAVVGPIGGATARETVDASGLVVAPGFIDVHTHADNLAEMPRAENFVRMGVTSIVAGNCGSSALDIAEALANIRQTGVSINFATLIGHNTVRRAVMGEENRSSVVGELNRMKSLVWRGMADGAVGFSTGLQYVPGTYARTPELIALAAVAANAGGIYTSHMRNEGTALEAAIEETLRIGESARARVQISHLKVDSPNRWGASAKALSLIAAARAKGIDVEADQYAYTAASSGLGIRFPSWALEGGPAATAGRLNDPATWAKIKSEMRGLLAERGLPDLSFAVVASYRPDASLNGLSMKQVAARLREDDSLDAQLEAARTLMLGGGASMVYHFMSGEDVDRIMRDPYVSVASDSSALTFGEGAPHPRGYGNNVRVLGEYVRARRVIPLEEAIRKMTWLPAEHFRFPKRGAIKEGFAADLVIFDPATVGETATFEKPHAYAVGIARVVVNGVTVVKDGRHTGARPGQLLTTTATGR